MGVDFSPSGLGLESPAALALTRWSLLGSRELGPSVVETPRGRTPSGSSPLTRCSYSVTPGAAGAWITGNRASASASDTPSPSTSLKAAATGFVSTTFFLFGGVGAPNANHAPRNAAPKAKMALVMPPPMAPKAPGNAEPRPPPAVALKAPSRKLIVMPPPEMSASGAESARVLGRRNIAPPKTVQPTASANAATSPRLAMIAFIAAVDKLPAAPPSEYIAMPTDAAQNAPPRNRAMDRSS